MDDVGESEVFDQARVTALRAAVAEGRYRVDAGHVARCLLRLERDISGALGNATPLTERTCAVRNNAVLKWHRTSGMDTGHG